MVMTAVLFVVSSLFVLQGMAAFLVERLHEGIDVSAYFKEPVSEEEILEVRRQVAELQEVKEVEYVSREEALRRFVEAYEGEEAVLAPLRAVGRNPLLAHLNVKARNPSHYSQIAQFLSQEAFASAIESVDFHDRAPVIERLDLLASGIRVGALAVIVVLSAIAVLVAFNTIRLTIHNSKEEIEIMRLVGASNWFIRGPFFVQGVLVGAAASFGAFAVLFLLGLGARGSLYAFSGFDVVAFLADRVLLFLPLLLMVGIGLGVVSSAIAINRYLKV